ncbi:uncharacterized protein BDR25DRAFT_304475 [Lindgomyces ingoldianus]|uniref:Uncharacterized protein n=1 Tax=Lindgomyces ingoldianus TaxID=673940 RepID=A0ACB6QS65_9PLEO|nr:uncharacterized protein BDR25DRAFT_304475 [Lindgomyces ingoldianus]KAF2469360.1 hypothetical protein BDR25DRAFT_304475 [Lindgomyces ingoldianus]
MSTPGPSSASEPDVMNDPEYATNTSKGSGDDGDTCRICRGEGTTDEPLFYPCKCSGSIKFVHQECLMEWLSHSQKKYCELCKTPFRFTKLYHPTMPNRIPTSVFLRRAAIHVLRMLITWFRAVLVASVWLVLLPYCMRVVWRSLFWVGDGGWTRDLYPATAEKDPQASPSQPWDLETERSAIESAKAANMSVSLPLPSLLMPFSPTLNMSSGEPTVWTLIKHFFFGAAYSIPDFKVPSATNSTDLNTTADALAPRNPSLLSDISFFNWFPSQAANGFLIDVLEGQIITLLVVVAFILIFLIREWVVQQQPVINMVALGDDDAAADRAREAAEPDLEEDQIDDEEEEEEGEEQEGERVYDNPPAEEVPENNGEEEPTRPLPQTRRSSSSNRKRQAIFKLWQDSDEIPEDLRQAMQEGSAEDVARVIERMPLEESVRLKEQLVKLSQRITNERITDGRIIDDPTNSSKTTHCDSNTETQVGSELNPQPSGSRRPHFPERSSSLPTRSSSLPPNPERSYSSENFESFGPLQRPNMPARDQSFIATEIRRNLEEANIWSFENVSGDPQHSQNEDVPESWEDEEAADSPTHKGVDGTTSDQEQNSDHSSESWQQVPDVVVFDNVDVFHDADSSKGKGKAKVHEDSTNEPHVGLITPPPSERERKSPETASMGEDGSHPVRSLEEDTAISNQSVCGSDSYRQESDIEEQQLPTEEEPEPARPAARPQPGLLDRIMEWLWGDVAPGIQAVEDDGNDERIVQDLADEAPFVPFGGLNDREPANALVQDPEVAAAAVAAGIDVNDQDAIDDAEDLEGIMELIGMQGPLTGLFQNAMFSAVLISATLACAVWFPYLWGKVVLLFVGSPISLFIKLPLQLVAALADFVVDAALCIGAAAVWLLAQGIRLSVRICTWGTLSEFVDRPINLVTAPARSVAESAKDRIGDLVAESALLPHPDYFRLSTNSHAALRTIQNTTSYAFNQTSIMVGALYGNITTESASHTILRVVQQAPISLQVFFISTYSKAAQLVSWMWNSKSYKITLDLNLGHNVTSAYTAMEQWSPTDRLIAIFAGYAFFAVAGAVYLKRAAPISTSPQGRKLEGIITDILQQAGGVLKVILIISIEMLAFPLYCGLLLDLALLPLFQNATLYTRWQFTRESPWTSGFVHWFIGTCYMFHFALFVSMCRKIMRRGVLYFIRDPDDPTFHPVRDVLERSVTTQLRKIAFSALVYGALVVICLGGVVWGLNRATSGVLPIHWASHAPSLEFPLDLLFYNFLTPIIIKAYKPSDWLHTIYEWWFKSCARLLRLSHFLFGDKAKEEEGHHVRRTWSGWFAGEKGNPEKPVIGEDRRILAEDRGLRVYFMFDGKYVRAPASDQVRIPKGEPVFVEVDRFNHRKDGKSEEGGVHNSDMVTMVYIPPWFRIRIALFVFTMWIFAAITGVGITVIPLLFGRYLFSLFLPPTVEMNDIHAFSLGIYTLGSVAYGIYHLYKLVSTLHRPVPSPLSTLWALVITATKFVLRVIRFGYVWTSLVVLIPFLFALLLELYLLMPLHAYLGPHEPHVVHLIQDWTLGFLYARLAARVVFSDRASRPARAFSAVVADGYTNPNARLATRCFLVPVLAVFAIALVVPSSIAWTLNRTLWAGATDATRSQVWRFSYPLLGLAVGAVWTAREGVGMLNRWRMVVRDEVYLVGERLHNFGERRAPIGSRSTMIKV